MAGPEDIEILVAEPYCAVTRGQHRDHSIGAQALPRGEANNFRVAKTVDSSGRRDPDIPLPILEHVGHRITRQAVRALEVIDCSFPDAVDAARGRSDPHRAIAVDEQRRDSQYAGVEFLRGERFPSPVHESLQPTASSAE